MNKLPFALLLAVTSGVASGACVSSDPDSGEPAATEPSVETISSDLDKANGGFTTEDEVSMFGDEAIYADASLEASADLGDPMAADPTVRDMLARPDVAVRGVVVMWGQLPADPTRTDATEWSGRITASRGAIVGFRKIGFEDRGDAVASRDTRTGLAFASYTTTHSDGLALRIIDPTPLSTEPLTLTYNLRTGGQHVLNLAALVEGPQVIELDGGNKIIAVSVRHRADCDAGSLRGRWRKVAPNLGHFLGVMADRDGTELGHVRGIFGERNGERRLFGKIINADGSFKGLIVGTFSLEGTLTARWVVRGGDAGRIHGVYRAGDRAVERNGGFLARWAEAGCSDDRPLLPPSN
jgi:hypothetical protein